MIRSFVSLLVWMSLAVAGSGCAGLGSMSTERADTPPSSSEPMDQNRVEQIFSDQVEAITGPTGALQSQIDGISIYCISDPANDRMRIVAPISRLSGLDPRINEVLLRANFHSALDARYAISDGVIFAAFLHPISSLTPVQIESAVSQVISLVKTFGTTFSSGGLVFPEGRGGEGHSGEEVEDANPPL
jgi:hypothetical protein